MEGIFQEMASADAINSAHKYLFTFRYQLKGKRIGLRGVFV
jgi:hypothetical protein